MAAFFVFSPVPWAFVSGLAPGLRCFPTQAAMAGARSLGDHGHVQFYSLV
jgi:hypothetical protein